MAAHNRRLYRELDNLQTRLLDLATSLQTSLDIVGVAKFDISHWIEKQLGLPPSNRCSHDWHKSLPGFEAAVDSIRPSLGPGALDHQISILRCRAMLDFWAPVLEVMNFARKPLDAITFTIAKYKDEIARESSTELSSDPAQLDAAAFFNRQAGLKRALDDFEGLVRIVKAEITHLFNMTKSVHESTYTMAASVNQRYPGWQDMGKRERQERVKQEMIRLSKTDDFGLLIRGDYHDAWKDACQMITYGFCRPISEMCKSICGKMAALEDLDFDHGTGRGEARDGRDGR